MVLVDTSVWIRFLANRTPYVDELDWLLSVGEVFGHELVYGELLMGDHGKRRQLLTDYEQLERAVTIAHLEIVEFVRDRKLQGRGVGWIDVHLLASCLVEQALLWTADSRLSGMAAELGIGYTSIGSA